MNQISEVEFRRELAGLEAPEVRINENERAQMKELGVQFFLALRDVYGESLDRKKIWERIVDGINVSAAKSGGKIEKFIASMLDYVRAEANSVISCELLAGVIDRTALMTIENQRYFIRICSEYRMLICLEARARVQEDKSLREQTGAKNIITLSDGTIIAKGEAK